MNILNALSVGTVIKLKKADKRVSIIGIMQQLKTEEGIQTFDYVGVPYPEGFLGPDSAILFQESDIELVYAVGYSDLERQTFITTAAQKLAELDSGEENDKTDQDTFRQ